MTDNKIEFTNEEMVSMIQAGETKYIPVLWDSVYALIDMKSGHYIRRYPEHLHVLKSDIINESYFGFLSAINNYDPSKGRFTTYLGWWIRHSADNVLSCYASIRNTNDALNSTGIKHFDFEYRDYEGSIYTLAEFVPDPKATEAMNNYERLDFLKSVRQFIENGLEHVSDKTGKDIIRCMIENNCGITEASRILYGSETPVPKYNYNKALRQLIQWSSRDSIRKDFDSWGFFDIRYSGVGFRAFNSRGFTSSTEHTALCRILNAENKEAELQY